MEFLKQLRILLPTAEEIIEAVLFQEAGVELTDRQLWILENYSGGGVFE